MRKPAETVARKNSLRGHEEKTSRGTRIKRELILIHIVQLQLAHFCNCVYYSEI